MPRGLLNILLGLGLPAQPLAVVIVTPPAHGHQSHHASVGPRQKKKPLSLQAADFQREKVKCTGGLYSNPQPTTSNLKIVLPPEEIKTMRVTGDTNVKTENIEGKKKQHSGPPRECYSGHESSGVILAAHAYFWGKYTWKGDSHRIVW